MNRNPRGDLQRNPFVESMATRESLHPEKRHRGSARPALEAVATGTKHRERAARPWARLPEPNAANGQAQLFTPKLLARRWRISHRTLERWRAAGRGPPYVKLMDGCVRYRLADVEEYECRHICLPLPHEPEGGGQP